MQLGSTAKKLLTTLIVLFALAVAGMIGVAHSGTAVSAQEGALEKTLHAISANNLNATGVAFADIYGEDKTAAAVACPGETTDELSSRLGVDVSGMNLADSGVPDGYNYLILADQNGDLTYDRMAMSDINLCAGQGQGTYRAYDIVPFVKDPATGAWVLAA
ncbi:hypothetical protein [Corynebacterium vitaeruminis]|uniref:Putative secreted protein n=1 Tax=Corynebacterium vitaeruminis DSM 20294 TaxID=1224164 RepID=W5XY30_9CORY|nr:hypothetical protein [Corynebacterium vitaeruminis]AHI21906.1 putative secreted protein [Corynebacterium vitaeruminis DSM 20294]